MIGLSSASAAPFGIEIFISPGDGVDEIAAETFDDFSVYLAHSHGSYGTGTFYFDATVIWGTTASSGQICSEDATPSQAAKPST